MHWKKIKMPDNSAIYASGVFRINQIGPKKGSYVLVSVEPIKLSHSIGKLSYLTKSLQEEKEEGELNN